MAERIMEVKGTHTKETENFHRIDLEKKHGIRGTVYVPKQLELPDEIRIVVKKGGLNAKA
jgi:hypothetical protein